MSRVVYMFDHIMQKFGLNGRSMVSLISSGACAIPAIMSTRTIGSWKERLITIMVCTTDTLFGTNTGIYCIDSIDGTGPSPPRTLQCARSGFMALYLMGIVASLLVALMLKWIIKSDERSFLMLELPSYKKPIWSNVGLEVWDKLLAFVTNAGKVIVFISLGFVVLASYGPGNSIEQAARREENKAMVENTSEEQKAINIQSAKLEASLCRSNGKMDGTRHSTSWLRLENRYCTGHFICSQRSICRHHGNHL